MSQTTENKPKLWLDDYALLPHPTAPQLLLLSGEASWTLPLWSCAEPLGWPTVAPLNRAMQEQFQAEVTTLRCVYVERGAQSGHSARVYWMENHNPDWTPPAEGRWIGREELDGLTLAEPAHHRFLADWFADVPPSLRPAWERPGWFTEATGWIQEQLNRLGITLVGRTEQYKVWSISTILRVETTAGTLYFKAVPEMFRVEARLTRYLAELYPDHIPALLAWDEARGWMLMRDMGGAPLHQTAEAVKTEEALRLYTRMQREMETRVEDLLAFGCRDRRLEQIAAQCAPLFTDSAAVQPEHPDALSDTEWDQLRALAPQLPALCGRLADYRIPVTLEHGDLHGGNIVVTDQNLLFFDWTDASVSHPFFSMFTLLEGEGIAGEELERLRNIYLEAWTDVASMQHLREAYDLSQTISALYHALNYYWIVENVEPASRWQWEGAVPYFLKVFLQLMTHKEPS